MSADKIDLTTPVGRDWEPVIRMVLGGIADRLDLGFDELDDLQLAVERLLAEGDPEDPVTLSFELLEKGVRTRVGPLRDTALARRADPAAHPLHRRRLVRSRGRVGGAPRRATRESRPGLTDRDDRYPLD